MLKTKHQVISALILVASFFVSVGAYSVVELERLSNEVLQKRYEFLIEELRCPKCQNQNLAGSDSMIAVDLRREVKEMLEAGKSDQEIKAFLVERYGDFVLYRPPFAGATLWVWVIPGVFIFIGFVVIVFVVRSAGSPVQSEELDSKAKEENQ